MIQYSSTSSPFASLIILIVATLVSGPKSGLAQESVQKPTLEELQKNYDDSVSELRESLKRIKRKGAAFFENKSSEAHEYRELWEAEATISEAAYNKVQENALALFFAVDKPSVDLMHVVQGTNIKRLESGNLTLCTKTTRRLLEFNPGDPELIKTMGRLSILTNDFDHAKDYMSVHQKQAEQLGMPERGLYSYIDSLSSKFEREKELRVSDAQGEPLPQAIIKTNKGTIVIELFENQAPETVGNFVNLVEAGFYDGMIFHRVLQNLVADTGQMTMNRAQPVGYTIHSEAEKPEARHHFRGSVSMVLNNDEMDTGGGAFRIMHVPGPYRDGKNTVFGRVISGLEVLDTIQATFTFNEEEKKEEYVEGAVPDQIKSITVTNLRDHPYEPNRIEK